MSELLSTSWKQVRDNLFSNHPIAFQNNLKLISTSQPADHPLPSLEFFEPALVSQYLGLHERSYLG